MGAAERVSVAEFISVIDPQAKTSIESGSHKLSVRDGSLRRERIFLASSEAVRSGHFVITS